MHLDEYIFVVECTTIKPKSSQWQAEGSSVPDHIKLVQQKYPHKLVIGLYLAPIIHQRITNAMNSNLEDSNASLICFEIEQFLNIMEKIDDKNSLKNIIIGDL